MKPHVIAAGLLLVVLFIAAQCVVIGGMAMASAQSHGQATNEFYRGMYYLCWDAYQQGYDYAEIDIQEACNAHVIEERDLKKHLQQAPGYSP